MTGLGIDPEVRRLKVRVRMAAGTGLHVGIMAHFSDLYNNFVCYQFILKLHLE